MALIGDHQRDAQAKTFLPQWPKIFFSPSKIQTVFIIIQTFTKVTFWHLAGRVCAAQDFFIDKESTKTKWWRSAALWDDNVCENQITSIPAGLTWRTKWLIKVLNSFVTSQKWRTLSFFLPNLQLVFSAWTHLKCQENYHWKNAFKWGILSHFRYFRDPKSQCLNFCGKNNIYFGVISNLFEFSRQNGKTSA